MSAPAILAAATAFPANYYPQAEISAAIYKMWGPRLKNPGLLDRFHRNVQVKGRHLALPIEAYETAAGFGVRNDAWIQVALELGEATLCKLLDRTSLPPNEIAQLAFTTVTGIAVPSIDARLMNRIPFSPALKRLPLFGLGCLGGAAGVARLADYLKGHPTEAAILLAIELCSLTIQPDDLSVENLLASGLFGDGAAAVLIVGAEHPLAQNGQPRVIGSRSVFFPDSEYVMGWEVGETGLKVVLSSDVPEFVEEKLRPAIVSFLEEHGLSVSDISHWIAHPGGPKVMQAMEEGLNLDPDALHLSRESLEEVGNISSASVLMVLEQKLASQETKPGDFGIMLAMGPAFCAELVLIRW